MIVFKTKDFSKKDENKKAGKIAAGVVGGTATATGAVYAGLKIGKNQLEKQLKKQNEEFIKGIKEQDKFIQDNVYGVKNRVANLISPKRRKEVEEAGKQLSHKVTRSAANISKLNDKIEKIDRVLNAPKKLMDKIKASAATKGKTQEIVSKASKGARKLIK